MPASLVYVVLRQILQMLTPLARDDSAKDVELLVLRHHVAILRRQGAPPGFAASGAGGAGGVVTAAARPQWSTFFFAPATLLRWRRQLIGRHWTDRMLIVGERHLSSVVTEYTAHDNGNLWGS